MKIFSVLKEFPYSIATMKEKVNYEFLKMDKLVGLFRMRDLVEKFSLGSPVLSGAGSAPA